MTLAVLSVVTAVFFILTSFLYNVGLRMDLKDARLRSVRGTDDGVQKQEPAEKKPLKQRIKESLEKRREKKLRGMQLQSSKEEGKKLSPVGEMLQLAEVPLTSLQFTLVKVGLGAGLAALYRFAGGMFLDDPKMLLLAPLAGMMLGIILPGRWLTNKVKKRQALFRDALPDLMDLLVVSVEAGLGFDAALIRLYDKDKSPLMEELMRAIQDVQHGMSKREAYGNASKRCGVKEITSFLNSLIQAEQLGISIKSVLKTQSESLREDRRQRAEEKALKAPVKMLVPLVLFIFPVIFIVLLGPAMMNILEMFG